MAYAVPAKIADKLKNFNGIRRTADGMLYLTTIDRETSTDEITVSKYYEEGKSDLVPKDETNYTEEREEYFNAQTFTGDGSDTTFTLNASINDVYNLAVWVDNVKKNPGADFTVSGTTLTMIVPPANGVQLAVAQINKRYFNNDSDKYQQFTYDDNASYLINSSGELVKRENKTISRTALSSDDYDTFEAGTTVNTTTYQDAV
jgi:hypothetical protein